MPRREQRERVDDDDALRGLEPGDAALGEPGPARVEIEAGRALDERHDPFAHQRVGLADRDRVADVGMGFEHLLDLGGADVLAAADDDVLEAADDLERAVGVERREVAGAEPAVGGRTPRRSASASR